jgi:hypothetical protein
LWHKGTHRGKIELQAKHTMQQLSAASTTGGPALEGLGAGHCVCANHNPPAHTATPHRSLVGWALVGWALVGWAERSDAQRSPQPAAYCIAMWRWIARAITIANFTAARNT